MNYRAKPDMFTVFPRNQLATFKDNTMPKRDWSKYDRPPLDRGFVSERSPRVRALSVPSVLRQAG